LNNYKKVFEGTQGGVISRESSIESTGARAQIPLNRSYSSLAVADQGGILKQSIESFVKKQLNPML
jgi:hypothetical protein